MSWRFLMLKFDAADECQKTSISILQEVDLYPILASRWRPMIVGTEWMIDAAGCREEALRDPEQLRAVFRRIVDELNLQVVGAASWQQFPPPGGVTGLALLTESHLTCHTYPEFGVATFNLYCCQPRPTWPWADRLKEMLGAQAVNVRMIERSDAHACVGSNA